MAEIDWEKGAMTPPAGDSTSVDWERGAMTPPAKQNKGFGGDVVTALKQGTQQIPGAITGLGDIVAGAAGFNRPFSRAADALGEVTGFQPGKWAKEAESEYSPATQQSKAEINRAWADPGTDAGDIAAAYATNPRATVLNALQSVPAMVVGGVAGRVVGGAAKIASSAARGAIGEGAMSAGQLMESIDPSVDPQKAAALSAAGGAAVGAIGGVSGGIANRLGIGDVDNLLAGGINKNAPSASMSILKRIPAGVVQEGIIEEAPQSAIESAAQNIAENKAITEGMARNVVEGALAGGLMGGVGGIRDTSVANDGTKKNGANQRKFDAKQEEWTTELGFKPSERATPNAPDAPEWGTEPGAARPVNGIDYRRDIDTGNLALVDPAEQERARAATIDFERQDLTPGWTTERGASARLQDGIDMPGRQFDTGKLALVKPSEALGIDPAAGALSAAAAMAVDSSGPIGASVTGASLIDRMAPTNPLMDAARQFQGVQTNEGAQSVQALARPGSGSGATDAQAGSQADQGAVQGGRADSRSVAVGAMGQSGQPAGGLGEGVVPGAVTPSLTGFTLPAQDNPLIAAARSRIPTDKPTPTIPPVKGPANVAPDASATATQGERNGQGQEKVLIGGERVQSAPAPTQSVAATQASPEKQRALDSIASGKAWFGNAIKAQQFIAQNGLKETHKVTKTSATRFDVVANDSQSVQPQGSTNGPQADQAVQATPQRQEAPATAVATRGIIAKAIAARKAKALDRIAKGSAYFGTQNNAQQFIDKSQIGDTHEAKKTSPGRWDVVAKTSPNIDTTAQPVANQVESVQVEQAQAQPEPAKRTLKTAILREAGKKLAAQGEADRSRERNTNTARRARMAAGAEAEAAKREAMGKTMMNLADAIESGKAPALEGITTRAAVETLESSLRSAMADQDRKVPYGERQSLQGRQPADADINGATLLRTSWEKSSSDVNKLRDAIKGKRGNAAVQTLLNRAPSSELVQALKKLGVSENDIKAGIGLWNMEIIARNDRLARAGIKTDDDLRNALRQYVEYRDGPAKEDPIKAAERALVGQKVGFDYFPTPKAVAERMAEGIKPGMRVLEPSAGNGNLADAAKAKGATVDVVEISDALRKVLEAKGYNIVARDFMDFTPEVEYDAILMNPPFSSRMDAAHIQRAYGMLKPGGTLSAIAGEGVFFGSDKKAVEFRDWLDSIGATVEKLPEGTFQDKTLQATTGTNARMIVIEKAQDQPAQAKQNTEPTKPITRAAAIDDGPAIVLQNRDRSSAASIAQMNSIAANPDYLRAGQSNVMDSGAPIVFGSKPSSAVLGKKQPVADGKGQRTEIQYAVVEAKDLIASHSADGLARTEYANGVAGKLRAVAGNARTAGITEGYRRNTADQYRADLEGDAQSLGLDVDAVRKMKAPVLVRIMSEKDVTADIGDRSNIANASRLSAVEQAATDARRLDLSGLEFADTGEPTPAAIMQFVRSMPTSEQSELIGPDGAPTRQAIDRLMAAIFKQAYGADELVSLYAQATDPEARNILNGMAGAAGPMAALKDAGEYDIRGAVAEAAGFAVNARRAGQKLSDMLKTPDMMMSDEALVVARFFANNPRSAKAVADGLRNGAEAALAQVEIERANQQQGGMFGDQPTQSRESIFRSLNGNQEIIPQDRVQRAAGTEVPGPGVERPSEPAGRGAEAPGGAAQAEGAAPGLTAEQAIRNAADAVAGRVIGSWYPITVTHNGRTQQFLSNIKRVIRDGNGPQAIHLKQVYTGKLVASDPEKNLVRFFKLNRNNELAEEGIPRYADERDLTQWDSAFGDGLTAPTREDIEAQQDRADNADSLAQREQIDREASNQTLTQPSAPEQRSDNSGDMFALEKAQAEIDQRNAGIETKKDPNQPGMFDGGDVADLATQAPRTIDGFKAGDVVDVENRTISGWTVKEVFMAPSPLGKNLPWVGMATVVSPQGKELDVLSESLRRHVPASERDRQSATPSYTASDAQAAEKQLAQQIGERIDAMKAGAVNQIASKFLPTMGLKPAVSKERNKAMVLDFTKVNPLAAAAEFGVDVPASIRAPLDAQIEGRLIDEKQPAITNEKQPATTAQAEPSTATVEDFGEKLPPARRAIAKQLSEDLSNDDIARLPLSQVWPASEIDAIDDPFVAAAASVMREAIPSKPRTAYKVKAWAQKVQLLRSTTAMLVSGQVTRERFTEKMGEAYALRNLLSKIKLLEQIDRAQWSRIGDVQEWPKATTYDKDGKQIAVPQVVVEIDGKRHQLEKSGDLNDHLGAITALLSGEAKEKRMAFEIRGSGNSFFINKTGDKQYRHLMEFTSVKDARDALENRYKDVVAAWEAVKERDNITERDLRSEVNRERTGQDWRQGKDVTAEEFQQQFGFRGGEFGKWVAQGKGAQERQFMLNSAYDALMDLSNILGIPPRAVSLEGSLGIAFGSRGAGWASAHFEPSNLVINLTKPRGAGALAHEWFHALDNYFARKRGGEVPMSSSQSEYRSNNYITHKTRPMMVRKDGRGSPVTRERLAEWRKSDPNGRYLAADQWIEDPKHKQGVRAEVEERFNDLVNALNESPMTKRARLLDGVKETGDGYWSRTLERAARSFENYVQSRMLEQGYHNDFLANVKDAVETGKNLGRYPYLMPSEIAPVADAFASLFDTIKTRETDGGKLELYEPTPSYNETYETDLFGNPLPTATGRAAKSKPDSAGVRGNVQPASAIQDTQAPDGNYYVNTFVGTEVERELGASVIKTAQDAAKATQYLYKSAVERLDGIITDKDGKPLAVVGGFKGAVSQTSVYPSTLLAEAVRIEGAANIWLSHNHPSGKPTLSAADRALNATLASAFSGSGIEPRGLLAIAGDQFEFIDALGRIDQGESTIPKSVVRKRVPVIERQLQPGLQDRYPISSPVAARSVAGMLYDGAKQPGIMLLDSQNNLSAWVPIPDLMRGQLRGTGGLNAIYRAVSQSNASGAVIAHGGELDARVPMGGVSISENIAAALEKIEVRPLDSINVKTGRSAAETGLGVAAGPVFSRQNDDGAPAFRRQLAKFSRGAQQQANNAVQSTVDKLTADWQNKPEIVIAFDMQDEAIPENVRLEDAKQRSGGAFGNPEGFYYRGVVYLLSSQLATDADIARVLAHESLGHYGLRGLYGKALKPILQQVATMRRAQVKAKLKSYGLDDTQANRLVAAEEVLAEMAQTTPQAGFVKRAIASIRQWLREHGVNLKLTDNDIIVNYIMPARGWVERGPGGSEKAGGTAFSRDTNQAVTNPNDVVGNQGGRSAGGVISRKESRKYSFKTGASVSVEALHGTPNGEFSTFKESDSGLWFTDSDSLADQYTMQRGMWRSRTGGGAIYPVRLSINNPLVIDALGKRNDNIPVPWAAWKPKVFGNLPSGAVNLHDALAYAKSKGHDGIIVRNVVDTAIHGDQTKSTVYGVLSPSQVASSFSPNESPAPTSDGAMFSRAATVSDMKQKASEFVNDYLAAPGKLDAWSKTVGTQYHLAQRQPAFKPVYDAIQAFIGDVSFYATEAANKAPSLLPRLETWRDALKSPVSGKDAKAIAAPIFDGTLNWTRDENGQPVEAEDVQSAGIVWTTQELKDRFDLSDGQIKLYREFRESVDDSLSSLAKSHMLYLAGKDAADLKNAVMEAATVAEASQMLQDRMGEIAAAGSSAEAAAASTTGAKIIETEQQTQRLIQRGYAPLTRFGHHTLDVLVDGERQYFGLFESAKEAAEKERELRVKYPDADITRGTMSEQSYKLFAGVTPETAELFGEMMGVDDKEAFQEYIKLARSTRSAMRRMIQREGIEGFSEDAGRVLAGFVYSNARQASRNLHIGDMDRAASAIPKEQGELKDHAINLVQYIKNPADEAQAIRGLLFAQYIGGSVASAMVNMTQPFTMSMPWLSQFGGLAKAGKQMAAAVKDVGKHAKLEPALAAAMKRAEEDGTVSPQEVFDLMKQAQGKASLTSGDGTMASDARAMANNFATRVGFGWGKMFSAAEQFNRRVTFIAAYRTAVERGMADPDAFARQAIHETQGVYNRGNRPQWARGAIGGTLFTFKQYSIAYMEMLHRMATRGKPGSPERAEGMRAIAYSIGILILLSGVSGAPGADDLDDLLSGLGQAMGYNFDSRSARRKYLTELFGDDWARFVERGVSGLPGAPIDVSGRMGLGNLIPGTGLLTRKEDHTRDVLEIAGPVGDLSARAFEAAGKLVRGEVAGAATTIAPRAAANLVQAGDMMATGMYRDRTGKKVVSTDTGDALAKAIGFQPNAVKRVQDSTIEVQRMIGLNKLRESEIADKWAMGLFEKDQDKVKEARDELAKWNEDNPDTPIRINFKQILTRLQNMNADKAKRIAKTAPSEIRQQVREALAQ